MERGRKMAEGKTKIIWADPSDTGGVLIESKDDITAGDGAQRDTIPDKAKLATATTVNCFKLLQQKGVQTHFCREVNPTTFKAHLVQMIPIEVVIRRIATGSYLKRRPEVKEGWQLNYEVEFFLKDDERHDPLIIHDFARNKLLLFDPKKPLKEGLIEEYEMQEDGLKPGAVLEMRIIAQKVFKTLEDAWAKQGVTLVDLKIEFGFLRSGGLLVADVIDNDSWRIWPGGDKTQMKDKQVYRDLANRDPAELGRIKENYAWVAKQTKKFLI